MKTFAKVIAYIVVALLVAGAIGLIYKFTNGFNEDFKTFYVEYDGKQILTADSKMKFEQGKEHRFDVKYTFDKDDAEAKDYSVKVVPNIEDDTVFEYTVSGEKYNYGSLKDLTKAFDIKKEKSFFTLNIPEGFSVQTVLNKLYSGKTVKVPASGDIVNPYLYTLVISSYNSKVTYNIDFYCYQHVEDITLDPDAIVFSGAEQPGSKSSGGNSATEYSVECIKSGDATNLSAITVTCPQKAKIGETVTVKVDIEDKNYSVSDMRISVMNSTDDVNITYKNGAYSFTMPKGNVYVWIYFEYTSPQDKTMYSIGYDSLGWAGMEVVNLDCPGKAAAGESVTFTATVKPEYANEYKISGINVEFSSGDSYIEDLQGNNGTYTFTMPDTATMENRRVYKPYVLYHSR